MKILTSVLLGLLLSTPAWAGWSHVYRDIGFISDYDYYVSDQKNRSGVEVVFRMRSSVNGSSEESFEELGVSMNCTKRSFIILDRTCFDDRFKDWDRRIGVTRSIGSLSPADQEVYTAVYQDVCF